MEVWNNVVMYLQAKLRDEAEAGGMRSGGSLSRSHSSPNIAKMLQDEEQRRIEPLPPMKPKPKQK